MPYGNSKSGLWKSGLVRFVQKKSFFLGGFGNCVLGVSADGREHGSELRVAFGDQALRAMLSSVGCCGREACQGEVLGVVLVFSACILKEGIGFVH